MLCFFCTSRKKLSKIFGFFRNLSQSFPADFSLPEVLHTGRDRDIFAFSHQGVQLSLHPGSQNKIRTKGLSPKMILYEIYVMGLKMPMKTELCFL